jgi:hypothetical protein
MDGSKSYVCFLMRDFQVIRMSYRFFAPTLEARRFIVGSLAQRCGVPEHLRSTSQPTLVTTQLLNNILEPHVSSST